MGYTDQKNILFVDDDKRILYAFKKAMERTEYNLFFADCAENAYRILEREDIDIAIIDLRMPEISGYEALEKLKRCYPGVFRLALIGYVDETKILKALSKNLASGYIIKPWSKGELLKTINNYTAIYCELKERGILESINSIESLPTIPDLYSKITKAVEEDADMEKIAQLIEADQSVSAKVIQIANSAFYNVRSASISKALVYLGTENIKNIVMSQSVFSSVPEICGIPLWQHSELTNRMVIYIYNNILDKKIDEDLYSIGLFHDIGKVIMINDFSDRYFCLCKEYIDNPDYLLQKLEKERFGFSHEEIGYYFMKLWGIADEIPEAALYHHDPLNPGINNKELVAVVHIANYYSKKMLGIKVHDCELEDGLFDMLDINKDYLEKVLMKIKV